MTEPIHIISLGAGVQSSTMALMAAKGEITPMPKCAIFADTQAEPKSVYTWLDWLEKQLPFPVYRVSKGSLEADSLKIKTGKNGSAYTKTILPWFTLNKRGEPGMVFKRECTTDYKINEIRRKAKELAGVVRGQKHVSVIQWIGISADEALRMKDSRDAWCQMRWPLIELDMHRRHCFEWMERSGYPKPPRSACVFFPFHHDKEWRRLKTEEPEEFQRAVVFERESQRVKSVTNNFRATPFLHSSRKPLDTVDFSSEEDRGQLDMFTNDCSGICGV